MLTFSRFAVLSSLVLASIPTLAQPPAGYYAAVDLTDPSTTRQTLHEAIDDHLRFPYTSTATDTWDVLEMADEDPDDASRIVDVYKNASYPKAGGGNSSYQREHAWPNSYGFPDDGSSNYPYTDCHALFLADGSYNASRGNTLYRACGPGCAEKPTDAHRGRGGGSGVYPGNSNWRQGSGASGTWETWIGRRGDVARALLYLDVRYEGGTHGTSGAAEPDLVLTDDPDLVDADSDNQAVAHMGLLSELLRWHEEDPVDDDERVRHEVVYVFQGNRNPFVDHPQWARCLFLEPCGIFADGFESGDLAAWTAARP